jgi:hypothetical protein
MFTRFYVDLDCVFDTRAGLIYTIYPDIADSVLSSPSYHNRLNDDMSLVDPRMDKDYFMEMWAKRDIEILKSSVRTKFCEDLSNEVSELVVTRATGVDVTTIEITINLWPYTLYDSTKQALIRVFEDLYGFEKVNLVSIMPDFLVPSILAEYQFIAIYDLNQWLTYHIEKLNQTPLFGRRMLAPIRLAVIPSNLIDLPAIIEEAEIKLKPFFIYEPQHMSVFSFDVPKEEKAESYPVG